MPLRFVPYILGHGEFSPCRTMRIAIGELSVTSSNPHVSHPQPDKLDADHLPQGLAPITNPPRPRQLRRVDLEFPAPGHAPFQQQLFIYSARRIFENSIKDLSMPASRTSSDRLQRGFGDCSGIHFEKPRPPILYSVWAAGSYRGFGGLISTTGKYFKIDHLYRLVSIRVTSKNNFQRPRKPYKPPNPLFYPAGLLMVPD